MKTFTVTVALVVASGVFPSAMAQVYNPANGHFYAAISVPGGINWYDANSAAQVIYSGLSGHLATITSSAESQFVFTALPSAASHYWLGGFQVPGSTEPSGGWQWVTGESWQYTDWCSNEPNNMWASGEDGIVTWCAGQWNDLYRGPALVLVESYGYVVEYEPISSPLMALPSTQTLQVGTSYGLQILGPAGASVALMFDSFAHNQPIPPYGAIGVGIPPALTMDGIGLGFPNTVPIPLTIPVTGVLSFSYAPIPSSFSGLVFYAQAVAVHASFAAGAALSTHGDTSLLTPSCQVTFVP